MNLLKELVDTTQEIKKLEEYLSLEEDSNERKVFEMLNNGEQGVLEAEALLEAAKITREWLSHTLASYGEKGFSIEKIMEYGIKLAEEEDERGECE